MKKVLVVYQALTPREKFIYMPEQLCDLAGVNEQRLVEAVSGQYWSAKRQDSVIAASSEHPRMIKATAYWGQSLSDNNRDRELFFRIMGDLPDKKGSSLPAIVINNNQQLADINPSPAGASGFRTMDARVIEMGKMLDPPDEAVSMPFSEEAAGVFAKDNTEED